jgi:hypothetical protein
MSYTQRFEDPRSFEAWKNTKRSHDGRNPSQKLKSQKSDCPILDTGVSDFPRTDRV